MREVITELRRLRGMAPGSSALHAQFRAAVLEQLDEEQAAELREDWMRMMLTRRGMHAKIALDDDKPIGFLFLLPIERTAWYISGEGLFTIQCMNVEDEYMGRRVGERLLAAGRFD